MQRFEGVKVLLTGGGSGIGRATVRRLLSEGATVCALDRSADGLAATVDDAEEALGKEAAGRLVTRTVDVCDEGQVRDGVDAAARELGGIDALLNVAGVHRPTPIEELSVADLDAIYRVNLVGTALSCREALRYLPERTGVIVNVASSAAAHGNPYMTAYSASKGAVLGFTLSLAAELVGRGIRCLAVSPGSVSTPLTASGALPEDRDYSYYARIRSPLGAAQPEQIAATLAYAASTDASYLTGIDLRVDGGSHI